MAFVLIEKRLKSLKKKLSRIFLTSALKFSHLRNLIDLILIDFILLILKENILRITYVYESLE